MDVQYLLMELKPGNYKAQKPELLLVGHDKKMADHLIQGLSGYFEIHSSYNGSEAFELARELSPDIIVSDIRIARMNDFELGRKLREEFITSHIPLVVLADRFLSWNEIEGFRSGIVDIIYKPFNMAVLRLKL